MNKVTESEYNLLYLINNRQHINHQWNTHKLSLWYQLLKAMKMSVGVI